MGTSIRQKIERAQMKRGRVVNVTIEKQPKLYYVTVNKDYILESVLRWEKNKEDAKIALIVELKPKQEESIKIKLIG